MTEAELVASPVFWIVLGFFAILAIIALVGAVFAFKRQWKRDFTK